MRLKRNPSLNRKTGVRAVALLALLMPAALLTSAGRQHSAGPEQAFAQGVAQPNVVVVMTDDQHFGSLSDMPAVRRLLARRGTTFANSFATHPVCCPSRATFLTGQYSHNHGVKSNVATLGGGYPALEHSETLPVWLQREGYVTAHIGKYLNDNIEDAIPPGWTEWYALVADYTQRMYGYQLNENGQVAEYGGKPADYQTDVLAGKAVDFIERRSGNGAPFFLSLNPTAPHIENRPDGGFEVGPAMPRNPRPAPRHFGAFADEKLPRPPSFDERDVSDKPRVIQELPRIDARTKDLIVSRYRSRMETLLAVDDAVARIIRALRSEGELERTLIVFTSDNGYFHGEHRIPMNKGKLYEEATRVPLVIRGPGFPAGVRRNQLVGNIDVAPTVLDAAGARAASGLVMDGRSLVSLASDGDAGRDRDLLLETGGDLDPTAVRTERYVYVRHAGSGEEELYNLDNDPFQLESLHPLGAYDRVQLRLADRLNELESCVGEQCRR